MDKNVFMSKMANILDEEKVEMEDKLESFDGWDSLAVVGLLGMYAEESDKTISLFDLKKVKTVKELYDLL